MTLLWVVRILFFRGIGCSSCGRSVRNAHYDGGNLNDNAGTSVLDLLLGICTRRGLAKQTIN